MTHTGKPRPLLLTHGWPGSVWEFYKILPMLTDPAAYGGNDDDAFEVICPSIPGYGFSEAAHQTGQMRTNSFCPYKPGQRSCDEYIFLWLFL